MENQFMWVLNETAYQCLGHCLSSSHLGVGALRVLATTLLG